ncbi:MAG: pyruvate phosphate dikinase [Phycisphaerales bacterium]|nr:pyruvate phosphate dikinase [Phycisphaerales bacterium]
MPKPKPKAAAVRRVYHFGNGLADGRAAMRDRLGGKGAVLADLSRAGLPVPPGFTVPTDQCAAYQAAGSLSDELIADVHTAVKRIEKATGKRFGDPTNPLLLSVRSGAAVSMPGMMETILNVGLNDAVAAAMAERGLGRFAYDSYRRLIAMYAKAVDGIVTIDFEDALFDARRDAGVEIDAELPADQMQAVAAQFLAIYQREAGRSFPQDPLEQLTRATEAVFKSWNGRRAVRYREMNQITGLLGTAVTVQAMVFGNAGEDSATGVGFTRDPSTGRKVFYGEFLISAQGEDLVAGTRTPLNCKEWFPKWNRALWRELQAMAVALEKRFADVQDFEFTVEHGKLYLLQSRTAQRTAAAAVKIAVDLVKEGLIDQRTAISRVDAATLERLQPPIFDPKRTPKPIAIGLPASPGAAIGKIAFTADEAEQRTKAGEAVLLVRPETDPEDLAGFHAATGVLTTTGGMTSHAAVVARGFNKPCVVGAGQFTVDPEAGTLLLKTGRSRQTFGIDDTLSVDGATGHVYAGAVPTIVAKPTGALRSFLKWLEADGDV